jgi:hypothetical protein
MIAPPQNALRYANRFEVSAHMTHARSFLVICLVGTTLAPSGHAQGAGALPQWQLSPTPVVRIGEEGDPNREFQRVVGVVRMPSGEIVVGNAGSQELRVFSPAGEFLRSISRRGQGPGELQNLAVVSRNRDTVFAIEQSPGPSQLHRFTLADGFRSRVLLRATNAPRGVSASGRLSTSDLLVRPGGFAAVTPPPLGTLQRDSMTLGVLHVGDPGEVSWLGTFSGNTWYSYNLSTGPVKTTLARYTLGSSLVAIASGDRVWVGDTGTGSIRLFDATGKSVGALTVPFTSRPFSEPALARAKARALESANNADLRSRIEGLYAADLRPQTTPRFSRLIAGVSGEVWVEAYQEDPGAVTQVVVVSPTGRPIATLTIPPSVTIHEAGADYAVGVETDSDGIQRIVQFRLRR